MCLLNKTYDGVDFSVDYYDASYCESPVECDDLLYLLSRTSQYGFNGNKANPFELAGYELGYNDRDEDIEYIKQFMRKKPQYLVLPLYKYEHSGVDYSISPYQCRFDSGQIGWLIFDREVLGWSRWSYKRKGIADKMIRALLKDYSSWCNGVSYCFNIGGKNCSGYFSEEGAITAAKEYIDGLHNPQKAA